MKKAKTAQTAQAELGNTIPIPHTTNTKRCRRFCFTLNNYSEEELHTIHKVFDSDLYIIGKEVGEQGTHHLQGYVELKNGKTLSAMCKINKRIHWEIAKGNREQNVKYCSKDNCFTSNMKIPIDRKAFILNKKYNNVKWKPWQDDVINLVAGPADDRMIHWYWESKGNVGKSFLCKYLALKYDVIICDGKKADVLNQLKIWCDENPDKCGPQIVICDIPRSNKEGRISYGALEAIKNGMCYSGKYEGGQIFIDDVHIICFGNFEPEYELLSEDRWVITEL